MTNKIDETTSGKFCILGAGSSGLATAKNFLEAGLPFDCLEREDQIGGNWCYGKPNSSVYHSTRLISSKSQTEYTDFPMPADWPEHPRHDQVLAYLRSYAQNFELAPHIQFKTIVESVTPATASDHDPNSKRGWILTFANGVQRRYRGVVIANGHNWDPHCPQFPGTFDGPIIHSGEYKSADVARGRRVLVVGGGNSGFDIAVDVSAQAAATFHSLRRQYHVLPRYLGGKPIDQCGQWALRWRVPIFLRRLGSAWALRNAWSSTAAKSLPDTDHRLYESHPVINSRWPYEVARGRIHLKKNIERLLNDRIAFADGSEEQVDLIIYATGYKTTFPFIDSALLNCRDGHPNLYLNVFHPEHDDLFVVGMIQPDSGQFGLVDYQAQLVAAYVSGLGQGRHAALQFQRQKSVRTSYPLNAGIRYLDSPRHRLEVEHYSYRRTLRRAIRRLRRGQ